MSGTRVSAIAYAKLTLSLRVLGRRLDGYHDLDALVVSLGRPRDTLVAHVVRTPGVDLEVRGHDTSDVPADRRNLAHTAVDALLARAGRAGEGVRLVLEKQIPAGAGLGGGSADAAAAIIAVRRLLDVGLDDETVSYVAASIGSDVPFCMTGGTAWMRRRGDEITPLPPLTGIPFLVAIPPFRLSTAEVYASWDALGGPRSERAVPAPHRVASLVSELANDLEPAAEAVEPRLREFREALEQACGAAALLAGSGSAYVVPVGGSRALPKLASDVGARLGVPVFGTVSVTRGVRLARP